MCYDWKTNIPKIKSSHAVSTVNVELGPHYDDVNLAITSHFSNFFPLSLIHVKAKFDLKLYLIVVSKIWPCDKKFFVEVEGMFCSKLQDNKFKNKILNVKNKNAFV